MLTEWETKAEIDKALQRQGLSVTPDQLERWRGLGLLGSVEQIPHAYRGSEVHYPNGTAKQVAKIISLLGVKRKFDFAGWELWWRGFPVAELYWRPRIERHVILWMRLLPVLHWLIDRDGREDNFYKPPLAARVASLPIKNFISSRIERRAGVDDRALVMRVVLETAAGSFETFEPNTQDFGRPSDQIALIRAFNFTRSEQDTILGESLNFVETLTDVLKALSRLCATSSKRDFEALTDMELALARDDVRSALRIASAFYEATAWIYGKQAFGLRLLFWIAQKADIAFKAGLIAPFALLRKSGYPLYSSEQIAKMADQADRMLMDSREFRRIAEKNPKLKPLLTPKRLRRAFQDQYQLDLLLKEVGAF